MHSPERSHGWLDASCGTSKPALNCPQNDDTRVFNQVRQKLVDCSAGSGNADNNGWAKSEGPSDDVGFEKKVLALMWELE